MANRLLIAGVMAIIGAATTLGAAWAEDAPLRKAGLWEVSIDTGANKVVARQCLDDATQTAMAAKGKSTVDSLCSKHEAHRQGNVFIQDSVCKIMGSERVSHTETTGVSENEFKTVSTGHYNPPMMGKTESASTITGKWLGPCGAELTPGEMIVNGHKIKMPAQP